VEPNEVDAIRTYLYFAFRNPEKELLTDAEKICEKALKEFPEAEAGLQASRGRLMRRLNRLTEAKAAFSKAIDLLDKDTEDYAETLETYQGQLRFVESELAKKES